MRVVVEITSSVETPLPAGRTAAGYAWSLAPVNADGPTTVMHTGLAAPAVTFENVAPGDYVVSGAVHDEQMHPLQDPVSMQVSVGGPTDPTDPTPPGTFRAVGALAVQVLP